jgi:hypothetical protein
MYCSGCGQALAPGQGTCPHCGLPAAAPIPSAPPIPGLEFELQNYAGKIRTLGIAWFIYAIFSLLIGLIRLFWAGAFFCGPFGSWMNGPWMNGIMPPMWFMPAVLYFAGIFLVARACLALAAGWGLMQHAEWGRTVAIVAAFLCLLKFPFGTAMGIWSLVVLLGYRNSMLYKQL